MKDTLEQFTDSPTFWYCRFEYWLTAASFAIMIFTYDEVRKLLLRRNPGGIIPF